MRGVGAVEGAVEGGLVGGLALGGLRGGAVEGGLALWDGGGVVVPAGGWVSGVGGEWWRV